MNRPLPSAVHIAPVAVEREYAFLVPNLVDAAVLAAAVRRCIAGGGDPHRILIDEGWVSADDYVAALSDQIEAMQDVLARPSRPANTVWVSGLAGRPSEVADRVRCVLASGAVPLIGAADPVDAGLLPGVERDRVEEAANGFWLRFPLLSARSPVPTWQMLAIVVLAGLVSGGAMVVPWPTLFLVTGGLAILFVVIVIVRLVALFLVPRPRPVGRTGRDRTAQVDRGLPVYSVIVPLYKEAEVVEDLVLALCALDYPADKLDILLVMEAGDRETLAAARRLRLPRRFRILAVPDQHPRTKPKALNYALYWARGEYVAVYDAEDMPEPDQLRKAVAMFQKGGSNLACLQARLNIHNPSEGWLAAQFAIEYSALFDGFLPALAKLGLPLPLGGTSNHFPGIA